ncbi:UDPglucose--hexose-1-phosphate uridylyltransferase [Microbacterium testaceum StLB037]|uniref:Galactose-1-phosphate uridylyltransferase n=1 Tax=Microbacterium testaceum (strain StLB037) TaxID=979556 RepID=A0A1H0QHF0_MICTS|nr:galactose-1-phosphate uridylyltransferase [Microbacterium testaceum]SDP16714.1 UDPglucose--hexose-1-phosphate uridylyltransferase [Microbacterium testaceum StLB037]
MDGVSLQAGVVKRVTHLADGRELIYFDDPDTSLPTDRRADLRELRDRPPTAQMRQDVLTGDWITFATARQNRAFMPPAHQDPLAPQTPSNPSEIPSAYDVAVFENKTPAFGPALELDEVPHPASSIHPLFRERPSAGRCEVVCFSPEHEGSFASLTPTRARTVIEAWADRTGALSDIADVEQVFIFENRGAEIGVTLPHPHGQIYAYPYVTPRTQGLLRSLDREGPDLFERVVKAESQGPRVVLDTEHWLAFVPFAARWPLEVHMLPKRHVPDFAATSSAERDDLADNYLRLLNAVDRLYDTPTPYIAAWHQAPTRTARATARLHLQLTSPRRAVDKLKYLAGSEAAMHAWVADIAPEESAERLRTALPSAAPKGSRVGGCLRTALASAAIASGEKSVE